MSHRRISRSLCSLLEFIQILNNDTAKTNLKTVKQPVMQNFIVSIIEKPIAQSVHSRANLEQEHAPWHPSLAALLPSFALEVHGIPGRRRAGDRDPTELYRIKTR